jgi:hypothetical protein
MGMHGQLVFFTESSTPDPRRWLEDVHEIFGPDTIIGIASRRPDVPYNIVMTGYIDAVMQGGFWFNPKDYGDDPETRLPLNSQRHVNIWQPVPTSIDPAGIFQVHGGSVPGSAIDIDANAPLPAGWGLSVDHKSVDDAQQTQSTMSQEINNNVSR